MQQSKALQLAADSTPTRSAEDANLTLSSAPQPLPSCSQPLGDPLPSDEHACSVSLPTWSSVVGYEEGDPAITSALSCGYPRFVYHPYVLQLRQAVLDRYGRKKNSATSTTNTSSCINNKLTEDCILLPTAAAAARCHFFLQQAVEGRSNNDLDNAQLEQGCPSSDNATSSTTTNNVSSSNSKIRRIALTDTGSLVHAVLFPAETVAGTEAKAYWQHTGEIVSSRRAEAVLTALGFPLQRQITTGPAAPYVFHSALPDNNESLCSSSFYSNSKQHDATTPTTGFSVHDELRERIAGWAGVPDKEHVFLTPSGMTSIYLALRSARRYQMTSNTGKSNVHTSNKGGTSIVYGFPYLDTLKLCSRTEFCPDGVEFFGKGDARDLESLERLLASNAATGGNHHRRTFCALFTEVPSNPLLQCPDLYKLRELADEYDFCLVVDDTISNFINVDILQTGLADAVCSSLTKLVSGRGDAMAGSLVANPATAKGRWMQNDLAQQLATQPTGGLFQADARAILFNSSDFLERNERINRTAEDLADWLQSNANVRTLHYPKESLLYRKVQKAEGGFGGLMSIILHPHMCQRTFYDALDIAKGPSLGTNFSLMCPYTLLAHYHELDFAMSYNVPPNLLRLAVGLEPLEVLQDKFERAFRKSQLYPKVCNNNSSNNNNNASSRREEQQPQWQQQRSFTTRSAAWSKVFSSTQQNLQQVRFAWRRAARLIR
jgi:cystathionine gamma-synthase